MLWCSGFLLCACPVNAAWLWVTWGAGSCVCVFVYVWEWVRERAGREKSGFGCAESRRVKFIVFRPLSHRSWCIQCFICKSQGDGTLNTLWQRRYDEHRSRNAHKTTLKTAHTCHLHWSGTYLGYTAVTVSVFVSVINNVASWAKATSVSSGENERNTHTHTIC